MGIKTYMLQEMVVTRWDIVRIGMFGAFLGTVLAAGILFLALVK